MVHKIDELNSENINELSIEELKQIALQWKEELVKARWVIWNLNKNLKKEPENNSWTELKTEEDIKNFLAKQEKEKQLNSFLESNPAFSDFKDDLTKALDTWLFSSFEEAWKFLAEKNETLQNNLNTNQAWISNWTSSSQDFSWKIDFDTYNSLSKEEQKVYEQKSEELYWWLTFSDAQTDE